MRGDGARAETSRYSGLANESWVTVSPGDVAYAEMYGTFTL